MSLDTPRSPKAPSTLHAQGNVPVPAAIKSQGLRQTTSTRLLPFPPPSKHGAEELVTDGLDSRPLSTDPYVFQASADTSATTGRGSAAGLSPANGPPKTPRPRQSIKDAAKPARPIRPTSTGPSREDLLEQKRTAATQGLDAAASSALPGCTSQEEHHKQVQHFALNYDDDDPGGASVADIDNIMD